MPEQIPLSAHKVGALCKPCTCGRLRSGSVVASAERGPWRSGIGSRSRRLCKERCDRFVSLHTALCQMGHSPPNFLRKRSSEAQIVKSG